MTGKTLQGVMGDLPTATTLTVVDNARMCGFVVQFAEQGFGFGELTFVLDKGTGKAIIDTEHTDPEHVGRILQRLVGVVVKGTRT